MIGTAVRMLVALALAASAPASPKDSAREEGVYKIFVRGREIGSERYALASSDSSASSTSVLDFRNPSGQPLRLHFETQLDMDGRYRPKRYRLTSDVDGKKGSMLGSFSPREAMFEYGGAGGARKSGLLVGEDYSLLDTNIFHHFAFLARRYDFDASEKVQRFEVVIPQESDSGVLRITEMGRETIEVDGKKHDVQRLRVDSGEKVIDLWVDRRRVVQKIAVPALGIEVVRQR